MNLTGLTDEPHRPGTPRGVRPATGTPAALAPLAQATDGARPDDAARPGFRPTGRVCHRSSARRGDGRTPNATFAHLASLAYLGFSWSLRARRFHRGFTAAAPVPTPASRRATAGRAKPLNRIAHSSPRRATWLGRGSGSGLPGAGRTRLGCGLVSATPRACPSSPGRPWRRGGLAPPLRPLPTATAAAPSSCARSLAGTAGETWRHR